MDKKLKAKWIKALRSGKYSQSMGMMYEPETAGFCCLGVLCSVAGAKLNQIEDMGFPIHVNEFKNIIDDEIAGQLADLNDDGVPFEVIAGLIQEAL